VKTYFRLKDKEVTERVRTRSFLALNCEPEIRVARFLLAENTKTGENIPNDHICNIPNGRKIYQMTTKCNKLPKIHQMTMTYPNIFHSRTAPNLPKSGVFARKNATWQPWPEFVLLERDKCCTGDGQGIPIQKKNKIKNSNYILKPKRRQQQQLNFFISNCGEKSSQAVCCQGAALFSRTPKCRTSQFCRIQNCPQQAADIT
jgi:hypothetical protein